MRFARIVLSAALFCCLVGAGPSFAKDKERKGRVTIEVDLKSPAEAKDVKLWIPYPVSDGNQDVTDVAIKGNYSEAGVYREPKSGNAVLYAEWKGPAQERKLVYTFQVARREQVTAEFPKKELAFSPAEFKPYLEASPSLPLTPKIRERALAVTQGKKTVLAKARALYDWIVENMYRDPNVKGCGLGEVERLLETGGGKCADIHSVFVALARAAGIPAREAFGIRMPKGREGDMTKSQHCWAEFYLLGKGWIVVDPADVRKYILEQQCDLAKAKPVREYYFGTVDESRIAFGTGRDITLNPPQGGGPLNYFMYPYAEADGKPLNEDLYGFNIGYKISFKEL
jgi:transglutaminase-like putative cysteine protease